jgi:hypothetical protein
VEQSENLITYKKLNNSTTSKQSVSSSMFLVHSIVVEIYNIAFANKEPLMLMQSQANVFR